MLPAVQPQLASHVLHAAVLGGRLGVHWDKPCLYCMLLCCAADQVKPCLYCMLMIATNADNAAGLAHFTETATAASVSPKNSLITRRQLTGCKHMAGSGCCGHGVSNLQATSTRQPGCSAHGVSELQAMQVHLAIGGLEAASAGMSPAAGGAPPQSQEWGCG